MANKKLSKLEVEIIKRRIFNGDTRASVHASFPHISFAEICHIGAGYKWPEIAWPDGSCGALPPKRAKQIAEARARVKAKEGAAVRRELRVR